MTKSPATKRLATAPLLYLAAVRQVLKHLEETQLPAIEQAADLVAHALANKGAVYCGEIGHGGQGDFLGRAGGLLALQPFNFQFVVNDKVAPALQDRPAPEPVDRELEAIRLAVRVSNLRAGDVLVTSSVSGRNRGPIELALACRAKGVRVIGFTAMAYTRKVTSAHPSGKRLFEVVDVAIDNGAPFGDAAVAIPGFEHKALPVSGVAMGVIGHMIWGRVMEKMAADGKAPTVFISHNREGGAEFNDRVKAQYQKRGY
jgi:uncharacterized phosphosugar-binding protein